MIDWKKIKFKNNSTSIGKRGLVEFYEALIEEGILKKGEAGYSRYLDIRSRYEKINKKTTG